MQRAQLRSNKIQTDGSLNTHSRVGLLEEKYQTAEAHYNLGHFGHIGSLGKEL